MGFYEDVIQPFLQTSASGGNDLMTGLNEQLQGAIDPYQQMLQNVEGAYSSGTVEPGPRYGMGVRQGPGIANPGMSTLPQQMPMTQPPLASTAPAGPQIPFYLQNPGAPPMGGGGGGMTDVEASISDIPGQSPEHAVPAMNLQSQGAPPAPGEPQKNEYESIVKQYLNRLMQPAEFPRPKPMNWVQNAAILLNPEQGDQLREQFQGQDYKNQLLAYQATQQRQAQGAGMAENLMQRQQDIERHDAERSWFRESAMANAGAPLPQGYKWKNPELEAVWTQKQHEKAQTDLRTKKYLESFGAGRKPASKEEYLKTMFAEQARIQGQLLNPAAQQLIIMSNAGFGDPAMMQMVQGMQGDLQEIQDRSAVVQAMDDADYQKFIQLDGVRQQQIIDQYIDALAARQMPGSTSQTAPLGQ